MTTTYHWPLKWVGGKRWLADYLRPELRLTRAGYTCTLISSGQAMKPQARSEFIATKGVGHDHLH